MQAWNRVYSGGGGHASGFRQILVKFGGRKGVGHPFGYVGNRSGPLWGRKGVGHPFGFLGDLRRPLQGALEKKKKRCRTPFWATRRFAKAAEEKVSDTLLEECVIRSLEDGEGKVSDTLLGE